MSDLVEKVAEKLYERDIEAIPIKYPLDWEELPPITKQGYYKQAKELIPIIAEEIKKELEKNYKDMESNPIWTPMWQAFWEKIIKEGYNEQDLNRMG